MALDLLNPDTRATPRSWRARALALLTGLSLMASACATGPGVGPSPNPTPAPNRPVVAAPDPAPGPAPITPDVVIVEPVTPPVLADANDIVRAAVLLPFSASDASVRREAAGMFNAAQLAVFESGSRSLVLVPKDTGRTADEARAAARAALADGADVIVGPLFAGSVQAVEQAVEAAFFDTPIIAFSNDLSVAGGDAYLLSLSPEEEIERIISFASDDVAARAAAALTIDGVTSGSTAFAGARLAVLTPEGAYGYRIRDAATLSARLAGGSVTVTETYPLSATPAELTPIIARMATRIDSFDAVLLPAGGVRLRQLAALLPYNDIDPREKQLLGLSIWEDSETAAEPPLDGGLFPALDPDARAAFAARYQDAYGAEPTRLAPFAYDAVALVAELTREVGARGLTQEALSRPQGFSGASGLFRFGPTRTADHALAVMRVRGGRYQVVSEAPQSFGVF